MISYSLKVIDDPEDVGSLPQFDAAWTTRMPLYDGKVSVGSYRVPADKKFLCKSIVLSADYADIPRTNGFSTYALGTAYFQVDGVTKMEYRVQWAGGTFTSGVGGSSFDASWRSVRGMKGAMNFAAGVVLRIIVSPVAVGGCVPQILWLPSFIMKDSNGKAAIANARTITTNATASQVILSYTVPSGGVDMRDINLIATSADFMMGVIQLRINGAVILETPVISNTYNCNAGQIKIPLHNGIQFGENDLIEMKCDIINSLNQRVQMMVFGDETAYEAGGPTGATAYAFI